MLSSAAKLNKDQCSDALGNPIGILDIWGKNYCWTRRIRTSAHWTAIKDNLFVGFVQNGEGRGDGGVTVQNAPFVLGKASIEKNVLISGIARIRGGGVYPCPNFLALFLEVHFWSIKRVYFFKNANVLNFNCFLGCIYTVYHIVYIVFLVLNWLSNLEFWPPKKRGPSCPNWGHGGGGLGNSGNARKKTFFFFNWCLP